jgi:arsenate reductase
MAMTTRAVTLYHNPRCSKSREALAILEKRGVTLNVVEYLKTPLDRSQLRTLVDQLGISPGDLLRRGEEVFREKYGNRIMTDADSLDAMATHPILMERPVVVCRDQAVIARPPERANEVC